MIGIRTDANKIIATGHMMRCITIAKEIIRLGEDVAFFVADSESELLIKQNLQDYAGITTIVLGTDFSEPESETDFLTEHLTRLNIRLLLVDSYYVTQHYFDIVNQLCRTAYIDDLCREAYPVDILINYSGYYKRLGYDALYRNVKGSIGADTQMLLGLEYAPLREQFYLSDPQINAERETGLSAFLSAGGADSYRMLSGILVEVIARGLNKHITWQVVAGAFVQNADELERLSAENDGIIINRAADNVAELMRSCDIAVTAAGTMLTECAAIKIPTVFYQIADNQTYNAEFWGSTGGMIFAGDVTTDNKHRREIIDRICIEVKRLNDDEGLRTAMTQKLSGITDGRGAVRIAKALVNIK